MGNQGMTNWKLTALFAVSLMLIAGLFSNAVIADGEGKISVTWLPGGGTEHMDATFRDSDRLYTINADGGDVTPAPLPAGSTENQLKFSYRVGSNMSGGQVKIEFPSDWAINQKLESLDDVDNDPYSRYTGLGEYLVEVHQKIGTGDPTILYRTNRAQEKVYEDGGNIIPYLTTPPATLK